MTVENGPEVVVSKKQRKVEKHLRRRLADSLESLSIRERIRNQWEAIDQERRFVEDTDRSARYAMIVYGAMFTASVLATVSSGVLSGGSGPVVWGLRVLAVLYALLAFRILRDALGALHPRRSMLEFGGLTRVFPYDGSATLGAVPAGPNPLSEDAYHGVWQRITGEELSRQLSTVSLRLLNLSERKHTALHTLYTDVTWLLFATAGLLGSVFLAAAL